MQDGMGGVSELMMRWAKEEMSEGPEGPVKIQTQETGGFLSMKMMKTGFCWKIIDTSTQFI